MLVDVPLEAPSEGVRSCLSNRLSPPFGNVPIGVAQISTDAHLPYKLSDDRRENFTSSPRSRIRYILGRLVAPPPPCSGPLLLTLHRGSLYPTPDIQRNTHPPPVQLPQQRATDHYADTNFQPAVATR